MIRRLLGGVVLVTLAIGGVGAQPATADDPPPISPPPGVTAPPAPTGSSTPGPTYLITPGVGGSELGAPTDPKALEDAKKAEQTERQKAARQKSAQPHQPATGTPAATTSRGPGASSEAVVGPQTPLGVEADHADRVGILWRGFAAAVGFLVLVEARLIRGYLRGRPRKPVTAG